MSGLADKKQKQTHPLSQRVYSSKHRKHKENADLTPAQPQTTASRSVGAVETIIALESKCVSLSEPGRAALDQITENRPSAIRSESSFA